MVLLSRSAAPFWATVKSALPTLMMADADCSSPLLTTARVTTVITAKAIAAIRPSDRAFLDRTFLKAKPKNVMASGSHTCHR